ncbi:MAG: hypothetical protein JOZ98_02435 [Solirubrobacterales bacterium]|nr:hypothetical protein [Solirubrobacterales bacterium]MBV9799377.1 hypothetical protein [Solirubrobacterales bacterium]
MVTRSTAVRRTELERTSAEQAREALDRGDLEGARAAIDGILAEEKPIHDLYGDMCASFVTFIASTQGEEAVDEAWRHVGEDVWKPVLMQFKEAGDTAGLARAFAVFLISHRYDFSVFEDEEKWTFEVGFCTSGERMVVEGKVAGAGGDSSGHHRFGSTSRGYPWSLGLSGFPYYDVHSVRWFRLLPAEMGWDVMDVEYDRKSHGELAITRYLIYKRPRSGPDGAAASQPERA